MKFTIKYLLLSVASLILVGCGSDGNKFKIEGEFTGMKNAELFIYNPYDPLGNIDTVKVQEGEFLYEGEVDAPAPYVLLFPNAMEHIIFVGPSARISYSAASNDLKNYSVKGSEENDLMTQFRTETSQLDNNKSKDIATRFILENLDNVVAKYLFDRYFIQNAAAEKKDVLPLLTTLTAANPNDELFAATKQKINKFKQIAVGDKLPDVQITDRNDKSFSLWKGRGIIPEAAQKNYTVVFVWATWLRNGYDFLWRVRQLCHEQNVKDNVRFVGIALDNNDGRWKDMTRTDSLIIDHANEKLGWNSQNIQKLGVTDAPLFIITDRDHKVISIVDDVEKLRTEIRKHIK